VRRGRRSIAAALLALLALVCIDALDLIQSDAWADLGRASHVAGITRAATGAPKPAQRTSPNPTAAFMAAAAVLLVGGRCVDEIGPRRAVPRPQGHHLRPPLRAPPALRFDWARP